jgi:tRNA modification GTPase
MIDSATIAAVASPAGTGGIGIIKISGAAAARIAAAIFKPARPDPLPAFESHRLYYGHVVDPGSGRALDEVLLCLMKAPRSYTREDVVEINTHGGPVPIRAILDLVLRLGARLAEPGEFTRRAFLNGRIDLTQAEAVMELIHARSERSLAAAAAQLDGALRQEVEAVRSACLDLVARLEAGIDFPEEADEIIAAHDFGFEIRSQVIDPLARLLRNYLDGRHIREGIKVAIVGRPNVGKSSLMNRLLGRERAIVAERPGTTRDAIEDHLILRGIPVSIWDTAGLRAGGDHGERRDPVEAIGMEKTIEHSAGADLILFVLEAHRPVSPGDGDILDRIRLKPFVYVWNKIDLAEDGLAPAGLPDDWPKGPAVPVSALHNRGIDALAEQIANAACPGSGAPVDLTAAVIPNLRQRNILARCLEAAERARAELARSGAPELVVIHIGDALDGLGEVLGTNAKADVLERIFGKFCIGK